MKRVMWVFAALFLAAVVSCGDLQGNNGEVTMVINVNGSSQGTANPMAVIDVEELMITQANISVVSPDFETAEFYWTPAVSESFVYTSEGFGDYTINVTEFDEGGNIENTSAVISMTPGFNYNVTLTLGGNLNITISSNVIIDTNYTTNYNTNSTTNYGPEFTQEDMDLTIVWHDVPNELSNVNYVWNLEWDFTYKDGMYTNGSYPVITGSADWMHTTDQIWDPTVGQLLVKDMVNGTLTFTTTVPAGSLRAIMFKAANRLGWGYGADLDGLYNHEFELPSSGNTSIDVIFDSTNIYGSVQPTNTVETNITLAGQWITITYTDVPLVVNGWDIENNFSMNSMSSNAYPVVVGSPTWLSLSNDVIWDPTANYVIDVVSNTSVSLILSQDYWVPAGTIRQTDFKLASKSGWTDGVENGNNHVITLPLSGGYSYYVTFNTN